MILIPAGWFWMGSENGYAWESPRHRVFVNSFWMAETVITRQDYQEFLAATGHERPRQWADPAFADPMQPVVGVNWFDAVGYCDWYSQLRGESYRLPTEAEWEKACRGGNDGSEFAWGDESPESFEYFRGEWLAPRPVSQWRANGFGFHNLGDNVHEWCLDWYDPNYYASSPDTDPQGPESGTRRISRGGSWRHRVKASRAAHRSSLPPEYRYTDYGFRLVQRAPGGLGGATSNFTSTSNFLKLE
jgi:formylglycine-generating enzyme required for sulfatase activity